MKKLLLLVVVILGGFEDSRAKDVPDHVTSFFHEFGHSGGPFAGYVTLPLPLEGSPSAELRALLSRTTVDAPGAVDSLIHQGACMQRMYVRSKDSFLHFAIRHRLLGSAHVLALHFGLLTSWKNDEGMIPLHVACDLDDEDYGLCAIEDIFKEYSAKGAGINIPVGETGPTPLQIAVSKGHSRVADLLRSHGAVEAGAQAPQPVHVGLLQSGDKE